MGKLGLSGNEKFDSAMQDRLGAELVRGRGADANGLAQEWASLRGQKLSTAVDLARQIPRGASTAPGPHEAAAVAGSVHPLDGAGRLSSTFGMRRHPISGVMKMHQGIDLAAPAGTIVKAMKDGIASLDRSGDLTVKHDDGTSSTYRHVVAGITAGTRVAAGQAIARLRAHDPRSTGPHLHLETRDAEGRLFDPKALLAPKAQEAVDGFRSTGWKAGAGGNADAIRKATTPSPEAAAGAARALAPDAKSLATEAAPSAGELAKTVPAPDQRASLQGGGGSGGGGHTFSAPITINAGNQSPQEMAGHLQRHITEAWNFRAHDLEPELT